MGIKPIIFLDRDGVLLRMVMGQKSFRGARCLGEALWVPDAIEGCGMLKVAGFKLILATNQPDVARGLADRSSIEDLHAFLERRLKLDGVMVCWHDNRDRCKCRKPKPGMLLEAMAEHGAKPEDCLMVGDGWRDMEAAKAAGMPALLLDEHFGLLEAADFIVEAVRHEGPRCNDICRQRRSGRDTEVVLGAVGEGGNDEPDAGAALGQGGLLELGARGR